MSSEDQNVPTATSTAEIMDQAADWLERADRSDCSDLHLSKLETWLSESPANRVAYWRVKSAWERAERLRVLQPHRIEPGEGEAAGRFWPALARTAVALGALVLLGVAATLLLPNSRDQTFSTNVGGHQVISLADGTKIELNTNTVLHAKINTRERTIILDKGEAYFQVAHESKRPFAVVAGDRRVTDLGTKFLVRRDPSRFEVTLVEGLARFEQTSGGTQFQSTLLVPGDVAVASADTFIVTKKPAKALASELGWRRGLLIFDHTTLADVAAEFNRYNREKLVIADSVAAHCEIFGTFQANNVALFARVARAAFGYRVEDRGDEIVISR
jgi:transmembrane sensor